MHIVLNGLNVPLEDETDESFLSYEQIVIWSGRNPEKVFTVTYDTGHIGGGLTRGQKVKLHNGMVFNVADTSNA